MKAFRRFESCTPRQKLEMIMADDDELKIEISDQVQEQMDKDPKLKKVLGELFANFHQAAAGVQNGQYKSFDDAMEAITGERPKKVDLEEEDIKNELDSK